MACQAAARFVSRSYLASSIMKYLIVFALLLISLSLHAESYNDANAWPTTVDAAVENILSGMDEENQDRVRKTREEDLYRYHHGWGTGIRNAFGLWKGNKALLIDACGAECHPDNASSAIIHAVWRKLHEKGE